MEDLEKKGRSIEKDRPKERSKHSYISIDSAPPGYSVPVARWRAPGLLFLFLIISTSLLAFIDHSSLGQFLFHGGDLVTAPFTGERSVPLRVFIVSYFIAFGAFSHGQVAWKISLTGDLVFSYLIICAFMDVGALAYDTIVKAPIPLIVIEILSGFLGYAVYSFKIMERGQMPSRIPVTSKYTQNAKWLLRLLWVCFVAGALTFVATHVFDEALIFARHWSLLGGIGPGVLLFMPIVFLLLYAIAQIDRFSEHGEPITPPLTIIIPAHNEEDVIALTIDAIETAAAQYGGEVSVIIANNNSSDNTASAAQAALAQSAHIHGLVLEENNAGKSFALNSALSATQTDFVVRIDADTQIFPDALTLAMERMKDPNVGVVGGLPLPPGGGMFDRARFLELVVKHGFYSVSLSALNAVVGVPGMFAVYRTDLPKKLGGFVQGMNGEDTDMSLRIGELGYQLKVDPRIKFVSEVPADYKHMREQRLRWFRSVFHVSARCRDLIYSGKPSVRGKILLPFMLLNSAMRAMMVPLILFGVLLIIAPGINERSLPLHGVLAVGVGAPALISIISSFLNRSPRAILYVPEYLLFRLLRAYFSLESNLSISVKDHGQHLYERAALQREIGKSQRDA